ncbi:MAG: polymer-forming cytoskeletal protein [Pseudomonadota bacterium]
MTVDVVRADDMERRDVEIGGALSQQQFLAGRSVRITAQVTDDIFAIGRDITASGASAARISALGSAIDLGDSTFQDVLAAGADVRINGNVQDDVLVAVCPICWWSDGVFHLGTNARVSDELMVAAGTVEIRGEIGGDVRAVARKIVVSGSIGGKAEFKARQIVLEPGAELKGGLTARSPGKPQIDPDAKVTGPINAIVEDFEFPAPEEFMVFLIWGAVIFTVALFLGLLLLGIVLQIVTPSILQAAAQTVREQTWRSIGLGLFWMLILPASSAIAFATVIGIPIGIVIMAGFLLLCAFALVAVCYAIGLWLRHRKTDPLKPIGMWGRVGWTVLGLAITLLVGLVPIIGSILVFLALLAGVGAVAGNVWQRLNSGEASAKVTADPIT